MARRNRRKLSANYLDIRYIPNERIAFHEDGDGLIVLDVENTGIFNRIAQRFFSRPRVSHISLDRYGSTLWKLLDGERDVLEVVNKMSAAFPGEEEKMLNRCVHFLSALDRNRFVRKR